MEASERFESNELVVSTKFLSTSFLLLNHCKVRRLAHRHTLGGSVPV